MRQLHRELFVWAVVFGRIPMAMIFWKLCPDQIGSALVASLIFKSLARKAESAGKMLLAEELKANSGLVIMFASVLRYQWTRDTELGSSPCQCIDAIAIYLHGFPLAMHHSIPPSLASEPIRAIRNFLFDFQKWDEWEY